MASINLVERLDYITPVHLPSLYILMGTLSNVDISVSTLEGANSYSISVNSASRAIFPILGYTSDAAHSPIYSTTGTLLLYLNTNLSATITIQSTDIVGSVIPEQNVAQRIYDQIGAQFGAGWSFFLNGPTVRTDYYIPFDPSIEIIPLDTSFIAPDPATQDLVTVATIRQQSDYITVDSNVQLLHSAIRNEFFETYANSYILELQNVFDYVNSLKTLYNIDYYDGDQSSFLEKINNLATMFAFSIPQFFLTRMNVENGDIRDLNKENDFLRNIIKRMWLSRRWAGTLIGYKLPAKWINRIAAVHLGMLYPTTQSITTLTGKLYRLLNTNNFASVTPGSEGTSFPNTGNIVGASSFNDVKALYYHWDTGNTWDQTQDISLTLSNGNTGITFSAITFNQILKTATFSVLSTVGATPGTIIVGGTRVAITASVLSSSTPEQAVAIVIAESPPPGWMSGVSGVTVTFSFTSSSLFLWDQSIPFVPSGQALFIEITLDRVLLHTNTIGTRVSLMDTLFHEAIETLLQSVKRAQDVVFIGSQITLITSKDGTYNSLAYDPITNPNPTYTHPNIQAKFQVFTYLPDKYTPNWNHVQAVSYIKVGSGGFEDPSVDQFVFVDHTMAPNDPSRVVLSDLKQAVFKTIIGLNERDQYGKFNLLNVMVHPRQISGNNATTITMNGMTTPQVMFQNALVPLINDFISKGTVGVGINIDYLIPNLVVNATNNVVFSPPLIEVEGEWFFTVVSASGTSGSATIQGQAVLFNATDMASPAAVANKIAAQHTFGDYTASAQGAVVTFIARITSLHQRIFVYEAFNSFKSTYDPIFKYQEQIADGSYVDFVDASVLSGYTTDTSYASIDPYLGVAQKNAVNLAPLYEEDQYSRLMNNLVGKYTLDEGQVATITDYSFNYTGQPSGTTPQTLNMNSGLTGNVTIGPAYPIILTLDTLIGVTFTQVSMIPTIYAVNGVVLNTTEGSMTICGINLSFHYGTTALDIATTIGNLGIKGAYTFIPGLAGQFTIDLTENPTAPFPAGNVLGFNGTNSYFTIPPSVTLNKPAGGSGIGPITYSLFLQPSISTIGSNTPVFSKIDSTGTVGYQAFFSNINLTPLFNSGIWEDGGQWDDNSPWEDFGLGPGTAIFVFQANILVSGISTLQQWNALIPMDSNWHQLTLSFDWVHSPTFFLDGVAITFFGTTTPVDGIVTLQSDDSAYPVIFGSGLSSIPPASVGVQDINGLWIDVGSWLDGGAWGDLSSSSLGILNTLGAWQDGGLWNDAGQWSEISTTVSFLGNMAEFRIFNRALTAVDAANLYQSVITRLNPLLSSSGNQSYVYIDHITGTVVMKPQYNLNGPLAIISNAQTPYSGLLSSVFESYKTGYSSTIISISEVGLFDANDNMLAYGTFPPVIYDSSKYHLAFNMLISI